jgi:hypothetical protein
MDEATFSDHVMGLVNSITTPLLSSLILTDNLINEEIDNLEFYGKIMSINQQLQASVEYFLELRALTFIKHESNRINKKNNYKDRRKQYLKNAFYAVMTIVNVSIVFFKITKLSV